VLSLALKHQHNLSCAIISIDDIYLTRKERSHLAETIHPLFKTRGVPTTHDVNLGVQIIQDLKLGKVTKIPAFDKASDDRAPESHWTSIESAVDVILFEGWCIGAIPQPTEELSHPRHAEGSRLRMRIQLA